MTYKECLEEVKMLGYPFYYIRVNTMDALIGSCLSDLGIIDDDADLGKGENRVKFQIWKHAYNEVHK